MAVKLCSKHNSMYIQATIFFTAFVALYFPYITKLVQDWGQNDNYSHGYFIPFISLYLLYEMRDELRSLKSRASNWGILLLLLGLLQLIIGKVGSEFFVQRTSMITVLFGASLFVLGFQRTKKTWFPIIYLIFMVPLPTIIWNRIAFPMQLFASAVTERAIQLMGIPIFREGNVLHLVATTLEVVDACSGLRSLFTMFALSAVLAFITKCSNIRKWTLFLAAAPIAILVNVIRLCLTAALASRYGEQVAHGFLHDFSGWLIFILGLAMLIGVKNLLTKNKAPLSEN